MSSGSVWNPENIRDVAESVGINALSTEVVDHLTRDVEFRISQVLEEALRFMKHAKRKTLFTQDISNALRVLDVEPLYGYDSTRPLTFGEASIGPGQPLYYVEDEEVDFEKLINAPLPKVPREVSFTAHWLAVEGVQPTIPQNPTPADAVARTADLVPKGAAANPHLAATAGADNLAVKPLVKHILSKELLLYFDHTVAAILNETSDEYRAAAFSSLQNDPGIHQLVPYFVQFAAEKVTHNLKSIFVLTQVMHLTSALLANPALYIAPYISALVPPILTCLVGKRLGPSSSSASQDATQQPPQQPPQQQQQQQQQQQLPPHYPLRLLSASILHLISAKHAQATPTLKPRLARSLLKHLLAATAQPLGVYYGALLGLRTVAGAEGVRVLILPNLTPLDDVLKEVLADEGAGDRRAEVDAVVDVVLGGLEMLDGGGPARRDGVDGVEDPDEADEEEDDDDLRERVRLRVGDVVGERVLALARPSLVNAVLADPL